MLFNCIILLVKKLIFYFTRFRTLLTYWFQIVINLDKDNLSKHSIVRYKENRLFFVNSNNILRYRINNFKTKEPETIEWIEKFRKDSTFWDIGANIGAFSILASITKNCEVIAFEPSYSNLDILAKNINLNKLQNRICIFPIPANNQNSIDLFKSENSIPGHAHSSFGTGLDHSGKPLNVNFEFKTISIKLDDAKKKYNLNQPDYIKIDVDGNEHMVLEGAVETIKNVKEILIELTGEWKEQKEICHKILIETGFKLIHKHSYHPQNNPETSANEIWKQTN